MQATFQFELPEQDAEYQTYARAPEMSRLICNWTEKLRRWYKYPESAQDIGMGEFIDKLYTEWWELLTEARIDPWE